MHSPPRLPVVVVDDDADILRSARLALRTSGWQVEVFDDLDRALEELPERANPFILLLDHDFQHRLKRTGYDLSRRLRERHPYGSILPICYRSGRIEGETFLSRQRELQQFAPTLLVVKGDEDLGELAASLDESFHEARAHQLAQRMRQAMQHTLEADDEDDEDDDGDDVVLVAVGDARPGDPA